MRLAFPASINTGASYFFYQAALVCVPIMVGHIVKRVLIGRIEEKNAIRAAVGLAACSMITLWNNPAAAGATIILNLLGYALIKQTPAVLEKPIWSTPNIIDVAKHLIIEIEKDINPKLVEFYETSLPSAAPDWIQQLDQAFSTHRTLPQYITTYFPKNLTTQEAALALKTILQRLERPLLHDVQHDLIQDRADLKDIMKYVMMDKQLVLLFKTIISHFHKIDLQVHRAKDLARIFQPFLFFLDDRNPDIDKNRSRVNGVIEAFIKSPSLLD